MGERQARLVLAGTLPCGRHAGTTSTPNMHVGSTPPPAAVPTATVTNVLPSLGPAEGESAAGTSGGVYVNHRPAART